VSLSNSFRFFGEQLGHPRRCQRRQIHQEHPAVEAQARGLLRRVRCRVGAGAHLRLDAPRGKRHSDREIAVAEGHGCPGFECGALRRTGQLGQIGEHAFRAQRAGSDGLGRASGVEERCFAGFEREEVDLAGGHRLENSVESRHGYCSFRVIALTRLRFTRNNSSPRSTCRNPSWRLMMSSTRGPRSNTIRSAAVRRSSPR